MNLVFCLLILFIVIYSFVKETSLFVRLIYIYHYIFFYFNYKLNLIAKQDSYIFFERAKESSDIIGLLKPGNSFMSFLIHPLTSININFFTISLIFSTLSLIGFIIFFRSLNLDNFHSKFFTVLLILPSIHFWSSGLSKEALVIFFMALVFAQIKKKKPILIWLVISLVFLLFIRPYLSLIILMSLLITFYLFSKKSRIYKVKFLLFSFVFFICSLPILKVFLKVKTISIDAISNVFSHINTYSLNHGNSSIPLEGTNYLERMNIVLYRPLFLDANSSVLQYIISLENLFFLTSTILFLFLIIKKKVFLNQLSFFLLSTSIIIILFLSLYMYNLGLASRMRIMFIPYIALGIYFSQKEHFVYEKKTN